MSYSYEVGGTVFNGDRIHYGHDSIDNTYLEGAAEKRLEPYRIGGAVTVHYNPNDPSQAVLETGIRSYTYFHVLLSAGLFATGIDRVIKALTT